MAITFTKDANGKVIVDKNGLKYSLDPSMNVFSHPEDTAIIIITDSSAPLETREVFRFGWQEVTTPTNSSRNDLVEKLGKNFFYSSVSVAFPLGLATEAKQDAQIVVETSIRDYLDTVETKLFSIITNTTGLNLEVTQIQIRDYLDTVETKLASLITNTTGLNLEATQLLIKAKTDNLDVALSTRASEATLIQVRDYLDTVETKLQTIIDDIVLQNDWSTTQATTTVAASVTSVLLVAANATRRQVTIRNTSNKPLYICMFTPATVATPFILLKDEAWVFPKWRGLMYGIWDTGATGNAYITQENV